jgi:host factor-I protein
MGRSQINLQDAFLNHVRKEKIAVTVNLATGEKVEGVVKGFDNFVILIKNERQHLIYKHAINTIVPAKAVELSAPPPAAQSEPVKHKDAADPGPETTAPAPAEDEEPWVEG